MNCRQNTTRLSTQMINICISSKFLYLNARMWWYWFIFDATRLCLVWLKPLIDKITRSDGAGDVKLSQTSILTLTRHSFDNKQIYPSQRIGNCSLFIVYNYKREFKARVCYCKNKYLKCKSLYNISISIPVLHLIDIINIVLVRCREVIAC